MKICIPTYKRIDTQITLSLIPKILLKYTYLICNKFEEEDLKKYNVNLFVLPDKIKGIGNVRQYVVENLGSKYVWFIDDDISFQKRISNTIKLRNVTDENFIELYNWNKMCLDKGFGIVGCSTRGGNNRYLSKFVYFGRIFSVYSVNTEILLKHNIRFDEQQQMEDFNVTLHLLRYGYRSIINTEFAHSQKASNQDGGCSASGRNYETQKNSVLLLAEKHKPFVKIKIKKSKTWQNMEERYDANIQWKKAFEKGRYIFK